MSFCSIEKNKHEMKEACDKRNINTFEIMIERGRERGRELNNALIIYIINVIKKIK